jgi:uncharacterized protein YabN with tetrapyrrole methylase and pyrophosphatase domain
MATKRRRAVDLYLLGRGVAKGVEQMTLEAIRALEKSRVVFDLSGDARSLRKLHGNVIDLAAEYWSGGLNTDVYARLEQRVLAEIRQNGPTVALVVDGHPLMGEGINWNLLRKARRRRMNVVAMPGVSSLDTMMIDVGFDLSDGAQIVEANDLLISGITLDPQLQTYVLQVAKFGTWFISRETKRNLPGRYAPLRDYLTRFYPPESVVTLIVSMGASSIRRRVALRDLDDARAFLHRHQHHGLTLHIPACGGRIANEQFADDLEKFDHLLTIAELA